MRPMTDPTPLPDLLRQSDDFEAVHRYLHADDATLARWRDESWTLDPAELSRWVRIQRRARITKETQP